MDIKNLITFVQVAESGSFSKAGEILGYSQPTVSVQIRQLEQELSTKLFDRVGHMVRLTQKGHDTLHYAQQILRISQQMAQENLETLTTIRLATADSLCIPLLSRQFSILRQQYPNISIHLTTAGTGELFRMLDRNEVDLVCTLDNHIYNNNYVIASEERVGVHFIVPASHPLAKKQRLSKQDLLGQDFLLTERGMSYRRLLDEWLAKDSLQIQPVLETSSTDLICLLVAQGAGMSFLPDYATEAAAKAGAIALLDAEDFFPELWIQLLYHRNKWVSRSMQAVVDQLTGISLSCI